MIQFEDSIPRPRVSGFADRVDAFLDYIQRRTFEFCTSLMMLGIAVLLIVSPQSLRMNSFQYMMTIGLDAVTLPLLFSLSSAFRIAALMANGNWPVWGPRLRATGAIIGVLIWPQMAYGLLLFSTAHERPLSTGFPVYLMLALGELLSLRRAGRDARNFR